MRQTGRAYLVSLFTNASLKLSFCLSDMLLEEAVTANIQMTLFQNNPSKTNTYTKKTY